MEKMLRADRTAWSKGVSLSGEPAAAWLETLSRSPDRRDDLRLFADIYRGQDIGLARMWTSGGVLTNTDSRAPGISITVLTEGKMLLRAGGEDHLLEKGDAVLYRAASLISTASELPVAVLEIELGTGSGERLNSGLINEAYAKFG